MNINPFDLLKNAQKIQEQMGSLQEKLGTLQVTGSAGGGMAEVDMNGRMEVMAVRIAPEAAEDVQILQDLIKAAFTNASEKAREAIRVEMGAMAGGLGLPPGFPGLG
jgi:DNA-binding YbaB/EbfC family protein